MSLDGTFWMDTAAAPDRVLALLIERCGYARARDSAKHPQLFAATPSATAMRGIRAFRATSSTTASMRNCRCRFRASRGRAMRGGRRRWSARRPICAPSKFPAAGTYPRGSTGGGQPAASRIPEELTGSSRTPLISSMRAKTMSGQCHRGAALRLHQPAQMRFHRLVIVGLRGGQQRQKLPLALRAHEAAGIADQQFAPRGAGQRAEETGHRRAQIGCAVAANTREILCQHRASRRGPRHLAPGAHQEIFRVAALVQGWQGVRAVCAASAASMGQVVP